jgi:hypothetical protein
MSLPFTRMAFFDVFVRYNEAVWPAQFVLYALAVVALGLVFVRRGHADRSIAAILALLWLWMGGVYHLAYFRPINPAASLFGGVFLLGAAAFAWEGVVRGRLRFEPRIRAQSRIALALIAYALVVYPLLALLLGHGYPAMPTFGLPCPTTLFTLGMLALLRPPYPGYVLAVPVLWTLVGVQAALLLGVYEDLGLIFAGAAGLWLAFHARRTSEHPLVS